MNMSGGMRGVAHGCRHAAMLHQQQSKVARYVSPYQVLHFRYRYGRGENGDLRYNHIPLHFCQCRDRGLNREHLLLSSANAAVFPQAVVQQAQVRTNILCTFYRNDASSLTVRKLRRIRSKLWGVLDRADSRCFRDVVARDDVGAHQSVDECRFACTR